MHKSDLQQQLAHGKILPLLLRLSVPITIAQLVHVLYNIVDRMFIGHIPGVGAGALASMSFTMPVLLILCAFANLIGMGGAPLLSIHLGEGDKPAAARLQGMSLTLLIVSGAVLTAVFSIFREPILLRFGASPDTLSYASDYLRIYLIGTVFMMVSLGMNAFLNAQGCTLEGTVTAVAGAVVNILLDALFINGFDMGVSGAALASVIAQGVSAVWSVWLLCRGRRLAVPLRLRDMRVFWPDTLRICKLGISSFIFEINECLVTIVVNLLLRKYSGSVAAGDLYIGAFTIVNSLMQVFFMPLKGITRGAQPIIGYCVGAKQFGRLCQTIRYARVCSICSAAAIWAAVMLFPYALTGIFTDSPALADLSGGLARIFFSTVFVLGLQMVNQHAFIAMGNFRLSFLFGVMRKVLILLPIIFILPVFLGVQGVFLAEPISNAITVVITQLVFSWYMRHLRDQFACELAAQPQPA